MYVFYCLFAKTIMFDFILFFLIFFPSRCVDCIIVWLDTGYLSKKKKYQVSS